jgi:hypothetical protein
MLGIFRMLQDIVRFTVDLIRQSKGIAEDKSGLGASDEKEGGKLA